MIPAKAAIQYRAAVGLLAPRHVHGTTVGTKDRSFRLTVRLLPQIDPACVTVIRAANILDDQKLIRKDGATQLDYFCDSCLVGRAMGVYGATPTVGLTFSSTIMVANR